MTIYEYTPKNIFDFSKKFIKKSHKSVIESQKG